MQKISSAETSVNKRLPRLFNNLPKEIRFVQMLDYGCGKYPEYVQRWANERGISLTSYDKYNHPVDGWDKPYGYDVVACSNVLNVVNSHRVRQNILMDCKNCLRIGGRLYITVYEGDKTGKGRMTKSDCWQENRKLVDYVNEVKFVFGKENVSMKKGMIIAAKQEDALFNVKLFDEQYNYCAITNLIKMLNKDLIDMLYDYDNWLTDEDLDHSKDNEQRYIDMRMENVRKCLDDCKVGDTAVIFDCWECTRIA